MCISGIAVVSSIAIPEAVSLSSFQFQVSHNTSAAVSVLFSARTLIAADNTPLTTCTSFTITREDRSCVGCVQLLVDNGYVYRAHDIELGNCTDIVNERQPYVTRRAAAVR